MAAAPDVLKTLRKSVEMLSPQMRRRWLLLIPLAIVTGVAEMGAAAGVFALVAFLAGSPAVGAPWFTAFVRHLPWQHPAAIVVQLCAVLSVYYILKSLLTVWAEYMRIQVSHDASAQLASGMLRRYLSAPYPFHFYRNSAELIRNCTESVSEVFGGVLAESTALITDAFMGAGVVAALIMTSPLPALVWGLTVVLVIWTLLRLTRRAASRHGAHSYRLSVAILQSLEQAFSGIKEVKVLGREQYFFDEFDQRQRELRELGYLGVTLGTIPRIAIQNVLFCGALGLVAVLAVTGSRSEMLPVASIFGYAGVRVLPLAQSLLVTLNGIRRRAQWVDELHKDFRALERVAPLTFAHDARRLAFAREIRLEGVSYRYPGAEHPALQDVSLSIRKGESLGIVGPTGAGKSTLVDLVLGLLPPYAGTIAVDGIELGGGELWNRRVGYVPQSVFLIDDTLRRNIALGIRDDAIEDRRVLDVMRMAQLGHFIAELPQGLDTRIGEAGIRLSGGERQRVAIARALYHGPDLVVFDEATAALDVATEADVTRAIESLRGLKTMMVVAHRLSTVRGCDRLIWLRQGRVEAIGSFDELRRRNPEFRALASRASV